MAGRLDATLLLADGAAAVRIRRPRLRSAQRAAAGIRGADLGDPRQGLLVYALGYSLASPLLPQQFRQAEVEGGQVSALVQATPGQIYWSGDVALNLLPICPCRFKVHPSRRLRSCQPGRAARPIMTSADAEALVARRSGKLRNVRSLGETQQWRLVRLDP